MLLDTDSASLSPRPAPPAPRQWYRAPKAPLPPEPGRLQTNALLGVARHARGCKTRGDDRLETRAYALKRLLWRWGHRERSGRYACSIWQLVDGLAPAMGWGPRPTDAAELARWHRAHAQNVRRWLEDLRVAGIVSFDGERDNRGQRWRTVITLHAAPEPPADELQAAQRRRASWARRRRAATRRVRRGRRRGQRLELVCEASRRPQAATRRRLAIARGLAVHACREAAAAPQPVPSSISRLRTHHFVAAPAEQFVSEDENVISRADAWSDSSGVTRARASDSKSVVAARNVTAETASITKVGASSLMEVGELGGAQLSELVAERVAAAEVARCPRVELITEHAVRRTREVELSTLGRGWPAWRLQEAWVVWRHGAKLVGEWHHGHAGPLEPSNLELLQRAAARYEQSAGARPAGWPLGAYAALKRIAQDARDRDARPLILHYAIGELEQLSRRMDAVIAATDPEHFARQVARARRRRQPPADGRLQFRIGAPGSPWPHWLRCDEHGDPLLVDGQLQVLDVLGAPAATDDAYREVLRDAHLVAGLRPPPAADGTAARVQSSSVYDVELGRRCALPGPYFGPAELRHAGADPADLELARLTGADVRDIRRLDVDERDRRLRSARAARADVARDERAAFWSRIQSTADERRRGGDETP